MEPFDGGVAQPQADVVANEPHLAVGVFQISVQKIHRWHAEKTCDETIGRMPIDVQRRIGLPHHRVAHHHDPISQGHRLFLIVRDVDRRRFQLAVEPLDLGTGLDAELRIEIRERFVKQKHGRLADDRPAQRDALSLAAGECFGFAFQQAFQSQQVGRPLDSLGNFGLGRLPHFQREGHVLPNRHVRIERVVLKHHRDVAVPRVHVVDHAVANPQCALRDRLQPGDHSQRRALATARGSHQHQELAVVNLQIDLPHGMYVAGIDFGDFFKRDGCHDLRT